MSIIVKRTASQTPKMDMLSFRVSKDLKTRWKQFVKDNNIEQTQTIRQLLEAMIKGDIK